MFTDMALIAYQGSDGLDAMVRSLKTAKPLGGVRIALVARNGEDLASATSDATGRVRFPHPLLTGDGSSQAKMLMAYGAQADLAVLDLERSPVDLSNQGVGGRTTPVGAVSLTAGRQIKTAVDGYIYADRGIYRPGETVHMVAMLRDQRAKALTDRKGVLLVKRPSGVEYARYAFSGTANGVVSAPLAVTARRWGAKSSTEKDSAPAGSSAPSICRVAVQRPRGALAGSMTSRATTPLAVPEKA